MLFPQNYAPVYLFPRSCSVTLQDGGNDNDAANAWPDDLGVHVGFDRISSKFEQDIDVFKLVRSVGMYRIARWFLSKFGIEVGEKTAKGQSLSDSEINRLAQQTADLWFSNYDIVSALGRHYGFIPIFIWQPYLMAGGKPLHPSEEAFLGEGVPDAQAIYPINRHPSSQRRQCTCRSMQITSPNAA